MKVGTDGTLLGAWARVSPEQGCMLDIGTGTGLIALMLAQRSEEWDAAIDAVEIDMAAARQAAENFAASPWPGRIAIYHAGLRDFARNMLLKPEQPCSDAQDYEAPLHEQDRPSASRKPYQDAAYGNLNEVGAATPGGDESAAGLPAGAGYGHIVSNPPYFESSLESPDAERTAARHTSSLTREELIHCSAKLLAVGGLFSVVLPCGAEERFIRTAGASGLLLSRRTLVRTLPGAAPKRALLEFTKIPAGSYAPVPEEGELCIEYSPGGNYTDEYRALTGDFYLKF